MSLHSDSISSRSASRHAASCGESTSTPSTSKIAPWNPFCTSPPLDRGFLSLDIGFAPHWKHPAVSGAQLSDLVADANADGSAEALSIGDHRELAARERHSERCPPELQRERQSLEPIGELRVKVENPVADLAADEPPLDQIQRAAHHPHVDPLLGGPAL